MIERYLHALTLEDAGAEDIAATRLRLKDHFPRGATRRMTQLGMLLGSTLRDFEPCPNDTIVFASAYAESRALESFLDSFPTASPTGFQTSIHPSAVQQTLIGRQQPIGDFIPLTGNRHLVGQALKAALVQLAPRVIVCGGEERGTWLLDNGVASDRSFAFALTLTTDPAGGQARVRLLPDSEENPAPFRLPDFFAVLQNQTDLDQVVDAGLRLSLHWL